jgi:hypothetical protein
MIPKYTVEYTSKPRSQRLLHHYSTDDPVTCEEALEELLEKGFQIRAIKHEGLEMGQQDFDRMIKAAAAMLASKSICLSLGIKPEEERFRFGFAAGARS